MSIADFSHLKNKYPATTHIFVNLQRYAQLHDAFIWKNNVLISSQTRAIYSFHAFMTDTVTELSGGNSRTSSPILCTFSFLCCDHAIRETLPPLIYLFMWSLCAPPACPGNLSNPFPPPYFANHMNLVQTRKTTCLCQNQPTKVWFIYQFCLYHLMYICEQTFYPISRKMHRSTTATSHWNKKACTLSPKPWQRNESKINRNDEEE